MGKVGWLGKKEWGRQISLYSFKDKEDPKEKKKKKSKEDLLMELQSQIIPEIARDSFFKTLSFFDQKILSFIYKFKDDRVFIKKTQAFDPYPFDGEILGARVFMTRKEFPIYSRIKKEHHEMKLYAQKLYEDADQFLADHPTKAFVHKSPNWFYKSARLKRHRTLKGRYSRV